MSKFMKVAGNEPVARPSYVIGEYFRDDVRKALAVLKGSKEEDKGDAAVSVLNALKEYRAYIFGLRAAYNNCGHPEVSRYWDRYSERLLKLMIKCLNY